MREIGWATLAAFIASGCIWQDVCVEGAVRVEGRCMFVDRVDGGADAMVDPNAPSAPEIRIDPAMPRTLDDLTAAIVTGSVDPLGDTVTYEYEWLLGDTARGTTATLAHTETTKHDEWTVRVTPVAGDRRGPAGTATVTIANTRPEVITAGLSTYHPIADERVRAFPDGTTDADGDTASFTFTWLRNDAPIADLTGDTIDLAIAGFAADDTLSVEVRADDGDDTGPPFALGPFTVLPAVTQWRPILPDRAPDIFGRPVQVHDEVHRRIVMQEAGGLLWEMPLATRTWVPLPTSGSAPVIRWNIVVYDPTVPRLLLFGGNTDEPVTPNDRLFELRLERSREEWRELTVGGDGPPPFVYASTFFDGAGNRILAFGSASEDSAPELWALNLTTGAVAWERLITREQPTARNGAWLYLPDANVAWYVGGIVPGSTPEVLSNEAWILSLEPGAEEFTRAALTLPTAMLGAGRYDQRTRRGIVVSRDSDLCEVFTFDPDAEAFVALPIVGDAARCVGVQSVSLPTSTGEVIVLQRGVPDVLALDPSARAWTPLSVLGVNIPLEARDPVFVSDIDSFSLYGVGALGSGETLFNPRLDPDLWHLDFATLLFSRRPIAADPTYGSPTPVRHAGEFHDYPNAVTLYGGEDAYGTAAPEEAWRLSVDPGPMWQRQIWSSGSAPPVRKGAVTFRANACGGLAMLGGTEFMSPLDDYWSLADCDVDGMGCQWTAQSAVRPPARSFAAFSEHRFDVYLFGGMGGSGALDDVWTASKCPIGGWIAITPVAPSGRPAPRSRHTMTDIAASGDDPRFVVFGGDPEGATPDRLDDAWFLDGEGATWTWTPITPPSGTPTPPARAHHVAAWDRAAGRVLIFGGEGRNDLWSLRIRD